MKISFYTIGCKLNRAETDELQRTLRQQGFSTVPFGKENICVVRACAVTCNASQTTREIIRQAKRRGSRVIAVGCLENKQLPEIDFIAKNNDQVIQYLQKISDQQKPDKQKNTPPNKTRALLKIQTGCNFNCAYCVVPSFRGRSVSIPVDEIIKKLKEFEKDGYKEVVLTGVNICQYKSNGADLSELLKKILLNTHIPRIRLGSLDPRLINNQLIQLYKNERLMPHWHLSLQSGSDAVLKQMRRGYTAKQYLKIVKRLRKNNPLFSFTTDIIVGFPGETEKEFKKTCAFVKKVGFSKIHIFPYSARPDTAADAMKNKIQEKIKKERINKLNAIAKKIAAKFRKKFAGLTREILFEQKPRLARGKQRIWFGYSPEYLRINYKSNKNLAKQILPVKM